ncbi:MAG: hypothetical protein Ct9H300mP3_12090 [Gammaproteobacteria bacterium]|nr:MAG: hypothetical protein Ct9H300mP3_12090 [Gammaproteobacteria bacterium]
MDEGTILNDLILDLEEKDVSDFMNLWAKFC